MADTAPSLTYSGSGTEPLRSNPTTKASRAPASPTGGKPAGGTENLRASFSVLSSKAAAMVKKGDAKHPAAVRSYKDTVR